MPEKRLVPVLIVLLLSLFPCTSCRSNVTTVQAATPQPQSTPTLAVQTIVVNGPTLVSSPQTANYIVQSGSLYGLPAAVGRGVIITGNVTVTGPALLQDLFIIGCVLVDHTQRIEMNRVWVQQCAGDGITYKSDPIASNPGNQSCCGKLEDVVANQNGGSGLHLVNTADIFISMSEFENNAEFGLRLDGSPTTRIVNSDFGGNTLGGLFADHGSAKIMLSNNQYGNNGGDDLTLLGANSVVNGQEFIGGGAAGSCSIRFVQPQTIGNGSNFNDSSRPLCPM